MTWQTSENRRSDVSHSELQDWRAASRTFEGLAAFTSGPMNISDDRTWPDEVRGARLTANAFALLRQQPLVGGGFAPGDDRKGADPVVIIGHRIWRDRYKADPAVVGQTMRVDGQPSTIVGVMGSDSPLTTSCLATSRRSAD